VPDKRTCRRCGSWLPKCRDRVRREGGGPQRELNPSGNWFAPPVAIRAVVEATKLLKPLVQRVAKATWRARRP